jgi:SAM-dependent methyltransferase
MKEKALRAGERGTAVASAWLDRLSGRLGSAATAAATHPGVASSGGSGGAPGGGGAGAGGPGYGRNWMPESEGDARVQILNFEDEQHFEETGKGELARLQPFFEASSTVLDLGCGIGRIARYVAPNCGTLWAVDASPRMLELARGRLGELANVRYALCADTKVPDVPDGSVDFVYSIIVLQHLEKEHAFLLVEDVVRMLKPGGRAFFTWPNILDDFFLDSFVQYARGGGSANPSRARMYTTAELERLLPAAGFSAVEIRDEPDIVTVCTR